MTDYEDVHPTHVQEIPESPLRVGEAVQHDGSTSRALGIVAWLNSKGIGAYASPKTSSSPALIKLDKSEHTWENRRHSNLVWPYDYVLVEPDNTASVLSRDEYRAIFVTSGGAIVPIYKTYEPTENKENN